MVSQDIRTLRVAYSNMSLTAFHNRKGPGDVWRGSSRSDGLSPGQPASLHDVAVVISWQTPGRVGSL